MAVLDLRHGDCRIVLAAMPADSVDAIVTDGPYGLRFMGKRWDYDVPGVDIWSACLRVLKPGGHLLAFAGTRTQHRMAVKIEDAGFEIRDMIAWVYGSGFPKSLDVSKAIDKAAGAEREVVREEDGRNRCDEGNRQSMVSSEGTGYGSIKDRKHNITAPATAAAAQWAGWGTALKPAMEPITVARKPLVGTVAENVLQHGTGAINVDGCRVGIAPDDLKEMTGRSGKSTPSEVFAGATFSKGDMWHPSSGRWPANLIHDGSDEVVAGFPVTGPSTDTTRVNKVTTQFGFGDGKPGGRLSSGHNDAGGSAARFFYCAKASKADRDEGCEGMEERPTVSAVGMGKVTAANWGDEDQKVYDRKTKARNHHPTVKPTELMRYLVRLVTPPGGTVLDPFMGSGSTGKAAVLEGFGFIGIERELEYIEIARARIAHALQSDKQQTLLL